MLLTQEKAKAEDNLAKRESTQDILLRNAITSLNTSSPTNAILQDILLNDLYSPEIDDAYTDEYFNEDSLHKLFEEDSTGDEGVTYTDTDLSTNSGVVSSDFDYNDYSHQDYLSNVAGKTITMPDGEVRTYSPDGTSYSIPAESWMGVGDSTYQITTHNKISGMAYPEPSRQYVGIGFNQARPAATAAATGNPWWLAEYGLGFIPSALGWIMGNNSGNTEDTKKSNASGTHTTSHSSPTSTGKVY